MDSLQLGLVVFVLHILPDFMQDDFIPHLPRLNRAKCDLKIMEVD